MYNCLGCPKTYSQEKNYNFHISNCIFYKVRNTINCDIENESIANVLLFINLFLISNPKNSITKQQLLKHLQLRNDMENNKYDLLIGLINGLNKKIYTYYDLVQLISKILSVPNKLIILIDKLRFA